MNIITLFCNIDDFFLAYEKWQATHCLPETTTPETRGRPRKLHHSEVMTLLIGFHQSGYRTLKHFYQRHVCVYWCAEFPNIESVIRELKTQTQVEHSRHRSFVNFQVNVVSALMAYQLLESKPSLNVSELQQINDLPTLYNP